ncbi:YtrH family sporulation protein [Paenibacillus sp. MWE-103]|uniref:YtrH family sporulation protein n=1 Tax=Paenibacillus artemisiicola TaxID=1172618 RepID=A0ABS3WAI0_9BACL|nr:MULTISPECIES: YtrH family sporulation protein [Paenibacillus]MBO7745311.1 YtrH family sporulation protein [Paenibacillus artemisiicola]SFI93182.1 Sporulation protein YtrH [Paenibacillus sp. UNC496MF]
MESFLSKSIVDFFIAFGVVFGGSMLAGMGSVFVMAAPAAIMIDTASRLKIWALVAAVGGTIDPMRVIESNMLEGHLSPVVQQVFYILCAFLGAHMGTELIRWLCKGAA